MSIPSNQPMTGGLRPVAVPAPLADPVVRGARPHLGWVEIEKLRIDDRYQRPLQRHNWNAIRRIAQGFDWSLFTVVDIAPAGEGLFSVIDGQHRVHAAAMAGIDKVPVRIVTEPVAGQARAFMGINGNVTAITPFHVLRASLAASEPWAIAADQALARAGCRLMTASSRPPRWRRSTGLPARSRMCSPCCARPSAMARPRAGRLSASAEPLMTRIVTLSTPSLADAGWVGQLFAAHRARVDAAMGVPRRMLGQDWAVTRPQVSGFDLVAMEAVEGTAPFPRSQAKRGA